MNGTTNMCNNKHNTKYVNKTPSLSSAGCKYKHQLNVNGTPNMCNTYIILHKITCQLSVNSTVCKCITHIIIT